MADWSREIEFREKPAWINHDGDGNWWLTNEDGTSIDNLTVAEDSYWAQYVYDWRAE